MADEQATEPGAEAALDPAGDPAEAPIHLTLDEAADMCGVSLVTMGKWARTYGEHFVVEAGGAGKAYKIDATRLRAWRQGEDEAKAEAERKKNEALEQFRMELLGGEETGPHAGLSSRARIEALQAEMLADKLRLSRSELCELSRAELAMEVRLTLIADFLRGLPDVLARQLGWDAETTAKCAASVESIQERLARILMEKRFLD